MESNSHAVALEFCHSTLLDVWNDNNRQQAPVYNFIMENMGEIVLNDDQCNLIKQKLKQFFGFLNQKLAKCNRNLDRFKSKHAQWLASSLKIGVVEKDVTHDKPGRKFLTYAEAGPRLKRKLASELAKENENSVPLLLHAASVSAKKTKQIDSPLSQQKENISENVKQNAAIKISPDKALAFLIENGLTKQQYINIKAISKQHGCDIYPPYSALTQLKTKCRPKKILYSETKAEVSLQDLLNHTADRILEIQEEVVFQLQITNCKLIASYGFDGSTGQSVYKQRFSSDKPAGFDHSLFVTSIIPLQLIDSQKRVIWLNPSPQSVRFCRPLKMEFVKETTELILHEKSYFDYQTNNLKEHTYNAGNQEIAVKYEVHLTLIDGKVLNILTNTFSCQSCPLCGSKPSQLLKTKDFNSKNFEVASENLKYGVSPLHAWIRFLEFVLKVSYRINLRKWRVTGSDKDEVSMRKQLIKQRLWDEMGLNVDNPKQNGSGNSNDGNTARRAFANVETLSKVLNFEVKILKNFSTILIAISTEFRVCPKKFKNLCAETFNLYIEKYDWYPMSPTVHKVLVHGHKIIESSVLPLGVLGENASEARNKLYKRDRLSHARKCSRLDSISDVFNRALDSSDPLLSTLNIKERQRLAHKKTLPKDVVDLLECPDVQLCEDNNEEGDDEMEIIGLNGVVLEEELWDFPDN